MKRPIIVVLGVLAIAAIVYRLFLWSSDEDKVRARIFTLAAAGSETGQLAGVLSRLADYLEARQALKQKIGLALIYPVLVAVIAIAVITALMFYVVPQVVAVFQQSRQALPWLTQH